MHRWNSPVNKNIAGQPTYSMQYIMRCRPLPSVIVDVCYCWRFSWRISFPDPLFLSFLSLSLCQNTAVTGRLSAADCTIE